MSFSELYPTTFEEFPKGDRPILVLSDKALALIRFKGTPQGEEICGGVRSPLLVLHDTIDPLLIPESAKQHLAPQDTDGADGIKYEVIIKRQANMARVLFASVRPINIEEPDKGSHIKEVTYPLWSHMSRSDVEYLACPDESGELHYTQLSDTTRVPITERDVAEINTVINMKWLIGITMDHTVRPPDSIN